jgi:3'-5' exoribonuclease
LYAAEGLFTKPATLDPFILEAFMEKIFIRELKKGQTVESDFLVKEKTLGKTKAGNPYLSIRLIDRSGEVEGRIWENAQDFQSLFEKDDFVHVRAEVDEFQGVLQLRVLKLKKLTENEVLLDDFLPRTSQNIEKMFAEVRNIGASLRNPYLRTLLETFFADDDFTRKFKIAPAAKSVHHVYIGGLLEHTLSLVHLILQIGPRYPGIHQDLLIAGGVLHDIGKVTELSFNRAFDYTDSGRLLGHIILSVQMIAKKVQEIPEFPASLLLQLNHMILSHHGEYEFGSPKRPKTVEALLLHHLDDLDAKMNGFLSWIEKEKDNPSRWTTYHRLFERYIFKPEE